MKVFFVKSTFESSVSSWSQVSWMLVKPSPKRCDWSQVMWLQSPSSDTKNLWSLIWWTVSSPPCCCFFQVQESFVPLGGASGELGLAIGGGADYGEFPFVTAAHGGGATVGDIILEIGGTPVLGMTLGDVRGVLNSCPHPIRIKTVSPGEWTAFKRFMLFSLILFHKFSFHVLVVFPVVLFCAHLSATKPTHKHIIRGHFTELKQLIHQLIDREWIQTVLMIDWLICFWFSGSSFSPATMFDVW